jgi:hypothetical protein
VAAKPQSHEKQTQQRVAAMRLSNAESAMRQSTDSDVQSLWRGDAMIGATQQFGVSFDIFIAPRCTRFTARAEHPSFAAIRRAI